MIFKRKRKLNSITPIQNILLETFFIIFAAVCIAPFLLVVSISLTDESSLIEHGFKFIPEVFSIKSYQFLWGERALILRSIFVSIGITFVGTVMGVLLSTSMGYALSRPNFKFKKFLTYYIFIPMIFNGGLVSSFIINTHLLGLKNSYWSLILPIAVSSFNIILARSYFQSSIPKGLVESAKIDGANEFQIFFRIILPLSKPMIATISLFLSFGYWNDWFLASLYITDQSKLPIQALLNNIQANIQYLAQNPEVGLSMAQYARSLPTESTRMAIAVIIIIPIALAYPFFQKYFISGLTVGSIKE